MRASSRPISKNTLSNYLNGGVEDDVFYSFLRIIKYLLSRVGSLFSEIKGTDNILSN